MHGVPCGHSSDSVPSVELGTPNQVKAAWRFTCDIALSRLFVKGIEPQQSLVVGALGKAVHVALGFSKSILEGDIKSPLSRANRHRLQRSHVADQQYWAIALDNPLFLPSREKTGDSLPGSTDHLSNLLMR